MKNIIKSHLKNLLLSIFTFALGLLIILNPKPAKVGVITAISYCLETLVPSLFPFMFLSKFIITSKMLDFLKKPLEKVMKFLFYLPGSAAPCMILSLVGGYPVGASGVKSLADENEITKEQLNRMMIFSVNAGPAFIISILGAELLKNKFLGTFLFITQISISILFAITSGIIARIKKATFKENGKKKIENKKISEIFVISASETAKSIINMSALIIIFTLLVSLIENLGLLNTLENLISKFGIQNKNLSCLIISALEITSGCFYASKNHIPFPIICFAVGYGGLCTHFQIASILSGTKFNYLKFHFFRLLNAICSLIVTIVFLNFFEKPLPVFFSSQSFLVPSVSSKIPGSIFLVFLSICFTLGQHKKLKT